MMETQLEADAARTTIMMAQSLSQIADSLTSIAKSLAQINARQADKEKESYRKK